MTDNIFFQYIRDIKKIPLLTHEEELALTNAAASGDKDAIHKLVISNLRLVVKVAKKYSNDQTQIMELIQEGNMGLMKAAKKISKQFNVKFSSYAILWIKQAFSRYLSYSDKVVKLPVRKELLITKMKKEEENYLLAHGSKPSTKELAKILGKSENLINRLKLIDNDKICSLDAPISDFDSSNLYDVIPSTSYNPESAAIDSIFRKDIDKCLEMLTAKEQDIVKNRYGLNNIYHPITFNELSRKYSLSSEAIRQTQKRAIRKLQEKKEYIETKVLA